MHAIIYCIINEEDNDLVIDGPKFYKCISDFHEAEILARNLASSKTKAQVIPWIFEVKDTKIPQLMKKIEFGWFKKFKKQTKESHKIITRDINNASCPFQDVDFEKFMNQIKSYI